MAQDNNKINVNLLKKFTSTCHIKTIPQESNGIVSHWTNQLVNIIDSKGQIIKTLPISDLCKRPNTSVNIKNNPLTPKTNFNPFLNSSIAQDINVNNDDIL